MADTTEHAILAQEDRLTAATRTLDIEALDRLYAEDIMVTGVLGDQTCTKAFLMDEARRGVAQREAAAVGKTFKSSYDKEDIKVVVAGDTAVTSYRFVVTFTGEGINVHRRYRTTNVWAQRQGRWQVIAMHTAFVLDAKQAQRLAEEAA